MQLSGFRRRFPILVLVVGIVGLVLGFWPYHGSPQFRYTGSDPSVDVWHFGWPFATLIWDSRSGLEVGPWAYLFLPALTAFVLAGVVIACAARHHKCAAPTGGPKTGSSHLSG